jgi:hypothetical protein
MGFVCGAVRLSSFLWVSQLDWFVQDKLVEIHQIERGGVSRVKCVEFFLKARAPGGTGRGFFKMGDKGHNQPNELLWKSFSDFRRELRFHCPTGEGDF